MSQPTLLISEVIERSQAGDTEAFAQIVRHYQSLVSGLIFSVTGDLHKSEDLSQETFLIAWRKLAELREPDKIGSWLCTIARNLAYASRKKFSDNTVSVNDSCEYQEREVSVSGSPENELIRKEQSELIWSAVGEMLENQRETLILYYRSGQSVKEIAEITTSTEEAVRQRLSRARQNLRTKLEAVIGEILTETAPGEVFTLTVMSALGSVALLSTVQSAAAAVSLVTGASTVGGIAAGTGGAAKSAGTAGFFAAFFSTLLPFLFQAVTFSFVWLGIWGMIRNTPTLRARRKRLYDMFFFVQNIVFVFAAVYLVMVPLKILFPVGITESANEPPLFFFVILNIVAVIILQAHRLLFRKYVNIVEDDLGLLDKHVPGVSFEEVEHCYFRSIIVNSLILETFIGILLIISLFDKNSGILMMLAILGIGAIIFGLMYTYSLLGRKILESCRTAENFKLTPPLMDYSFEIALGRMGKASEPTGHAAQPRKLGKYGIVTLIMIGVIQLWLVSQLNWTINPVGTGVCICFIIAGPIGCGNVTKRIKNAKYRYYLMAISACLNSLAVFILLVIQAGDCSFTAFRNASTSQNSLAFNIYFGLLFMYAILFFVSLTQGLIKTKNSIQIDNEYSEKLAEALARYKSETESNSCMTPNPLDAVAKAFPVVWKLVFILYGTAIMCLYVIGALIPKTFSF
ncbi:MAG: RNA polymerase sigma factor [Thermoguttaceae bacterium]